MSDTNRRTALKSIGAAAALANIAKTSNATPAAAVTPGQCTWGKTTNRIWLGGDYWANPMEDWRVVDGAAECQSFGGGRNIHLITHQLTNPEKGFEMQVTVRQVEQKKTDGGVGFRIGVKSELNEYRSNAFSGGGIVAGIRGDQLVIENGRKSKSIPIDLDLSQDVHLTIRGVAGSNPNEQGLSLQLAAVQDGKTMEVKLDGVAGEQLLGNIAVCNNFEMKQPNGRGSRYRFSDWNVSGDAFTVDAERRFGPILWTMYSLSDSRSDEGFVMKLSALTGPLGEQDNQSIELHVEKDGKWTSLGTAALDTDAWTATFRIPNWDETTVTPFKVTYSENHTDGSSTESSWSGSIKANPTGRPLRMAALTCQNHYGFPYEPVANNVKELDPDLIYFSGDQLYESHGGYGLIREPAVPAILNYLRKYYMFGWAFRDAIRNAPTLCIPDDHDVFQGNIWGEGGAPMKELDKGASSKGGYREPARMVNVVHKTNCAHHPDFYDATPVKQGISVYYGDMVYGNVSFAILGDRQFKSGPERVETGSGRADHVRDRNVDTLHLDKPGLVLLGERQEDFLKAWGEDWRGHEMKVLLSQTVFAGVATHHGSYTGYLKADLDSGGWPQTARNRTVSILKTGMPLHINGDQHLTSMVQYGDKEQRDSCWSFCTPAIAAGYPRWWRPDEIEMPHENRPSHGLPNTGEFVDGFGNKAYVYAVGNPVVGKDKNRYKKAHEKGSGFGFVTIDTNSKTYLVEAFKFLVDAKDGNPENQFPGWPLTIKQKENRGENEIS